MFSIFGILMRPIVSIVTVLVLIGVGIYGYRQWSGVTNSADEVLEKYVSLLQNPSIDTISQTDQQILNQVIEKSNFDFFNQAEIQVKALRKLKEKRTLNIGKLQYTDNQNYAISILDFRSQNSDPKIVSVKVYLQKNTSNILLGDHWKVYKVDMPSKPEDILNQLKDQGQNLLNNLPNLIPQNR